MELVDRHHMLLIAAVIVLAHDLSHDSGAHAWSYNYSMDPVRTWDDAREWCRAHFIDMVSVQSSEETTFLNNTIPRLSSYYWIGVRKLAGKWTWVATNKPIPRENQNWASREPDRLRGQDCVEMYIKREKDTAKWNNENCNKMKGTLCYYASCAQDSCSVHGDCEEVIGNFTCRCKPGFQGRRCDEAVSCEPLLEPAHGSHNCSGSYGPSHYNSSCSFHCKLGFCLVGVPQLLCQANGQWNHLAPLCQAKECPALNDTDIRNGNMNCSHPFALYSYNSTCEVRCDEGYKLDGDSSMQCDHTGQWTANVSSCFVKKCPHISFPATGNMTCVDSVMPFSYGSWCNFTCREGFYLTGNNTVTCLASERWSEPTPTCTLVNCSSLDVPQHATMECMDPHGNFSFGSACTFHCTEGFELIGTNMTECLSGGNWSHTLPVCQAKRCPTLKSSAHGSLVCSHPHGAFSFGSRCNSSCEKGFVLNGTANIECTSVGTWSREIPSCLARSCPLLVKPPQHGRVNCTHPHSEFSFASRCDFGCDEGFWLEGAPTLTCNSSGNWSQDLPTCQPNRCPALNSSAHGSLDCSHPHGAFSFGSRCNSSCEEGFLLNGTADTECTSLGTWSKDVPHCIAMRCPTLNSSAHGSFVCSHPHGAFHFGSMCNLTCKEGFVLNGTASTECTSAGMWSNDLPSCLARSCSLLPKAPQHGSVNCTHPHSTFSYGSYCDFECNEGFLLRGTPSMMCNTSGIWSQDLPTCQPVQCQPLRASSVTLSMNCSHPLEIFSFTSRCTVACEEGYSLNGTEVLTCSSDGFWNASVPSCRAEGMPFGTALLLYTGVGAGVALVPLALILLGLILKRLFTQKGKGVINNAPMWEERENPAFEFD